MHYPSNCKTAACAANKPKADNFTIPMATITWAFAAVLIGACSLNAVRQRFFELFWYVHHFFVAVIIVVMMHAASAWVLTRAGSIN